MTEVEKFNSDIQRLAKRRRAEGCSAEKICEELTALFIRIASIPGALSESCAEYWKRTYIDAASNSKDEPSEENINRLCAVLGFLKGTGEAENFLTDDDWIMLGKLVNYEAEDLPIEILQNLMGTILDKGAL